MSQAQAYRPSHGGYPDLGGKAMAPDVPPRDILADRQAQAVAGGLHATSIGEIYPLAIVGRGNAEKVVYELHDLQRGTIARCHGKESPARQWPRASLAYDYAVKLLSGDSATVWG